MTQKPCLPQHSEDLLAALRDRRIAIVGNATPRRSFGAVIDRYDAVIRINNFRIAGFEKLVGRRTDYRCTTGHCDIEHRNEHPEFSPFTAEAIESAHLKKFNAANGRPVLAARTDVHPLIRETSKPSTGLSLVQLTTQLGLPVDLFGFDGFKTPHYWEQDSAFHTTHASNEFNAILSRPNVIAFGETYPYAELYDFCHSNHRDYEHNVGLELARRIGFSIREKSVIEFGAGNGDLSHHLESLGNRVTPVEVSPQAFAKIRCAKKILGDAFTIAELQESFDVFASVDVLEHLTENDIRLVLREAGRLAESLFLSVSTRPSGLLGPKGENLHLTVRPAEWWMEQVGRYFDVELSNGYGAGQIVLEGRRKARRTAPEVGARGSSIPANYCLKLGYQPRPTPKYFEDTVTDTDGIVWQPDVYPVAAAIARKLRAGCVIDVGCGRAHKLLELQDEFETIGIDFGANLEFCQKEHSKGKWIEADFEEPAALPCSAVDAADAVVICSDVIEHMMRPEALLEKIRHLLEHALVAVISTPERDLTWGKEHSGPPPNPCHTMEWNLAEFVELLRGAGLTVEFAGVTRSHDRDPARKTILAVVGSADGRHLARFGGKQEAFQNWVSELNGTAGEEPKRAAVVEGEYPLVSVIVPTCNRPEWLKEAVESILGQTYRNFEILVVNDAGEDVTGVIAALNAKGRIRVVTHSSNKGLAAARNTGIREARGRYIAYLDDDDIFHADHLATLVECLTSGAGEVAYTDAYRATQEKRGERYEVVKRDVPYSHDWDGDEILVRNFVPVICFMHERRCVEKAGWFDESLTTHEDWDLWMRMSRHFRFTHIKKVTCEFRWREDGSSMSSQRRADFLRTAEIIYRKSPELTAGRHGIAWRRQQHLLEVSHSLRGVEGKPTPATLLVSIVIPVFNKVELTRECVEAIHRETAAGTFEIIVVDNASSDGTREYLEAEQAAGRLRTVRNEENFGFAIACNQGIRAASGGFILLLNNDTVPQPGWLEPMVEEFIYHSKAGAVGSCLLYPGGELIQHAGVRIGAGGGRLHPYHPWRLQALKRVPEARKSRDCQVVTGACLLMRRAALDEVGLLDEGFVNGFEDVDLCLRMRQAGHRIRYCATSRVIHHESMTPGRNLHEQRNYARLNERWKSTIQPDESAESTALQALEMNCRQRLVTEPGNPRALGYMVQLCAGRRDAEQAAEWQAVWNRATDGGKATPVSVSVVIPVMNNLALTKQCLEAVDKTAGLTVSELIVVDNASTDGTPEFLAPLAAKGGLRVIRNDSNLGFARACNQGAAAARGQFVLFLNNDTVPTAGWIDFMVMAAHREGVGVVGAKLLYASGAIQHAGIGFINGVPDHPWRNFPAFAPEVNAFRELDMVTGACFLMPRELFLQLGGFDETYQNGVEDVDLCLRARSCGRKVVYEPQAVVYHLEGQSAGRFDHVSRNLQLFFQRWGGSFDENFQFKAPEDPRMVPASQSILLAAEKPVVVSWEGSFLDYGSLSHVNREWTREIERDRGIQLARVGSGTLTSSAFAGLELSARAPADVQVTVRHSWPPNWSRPAQGKLVVSQPWEFGALPKDWVRQAADVDEFWVPTRLVQKFYTDSGIPEAKVKIVPYGVEIERFHPGAERRRLATTKSFKFLFVGGTIWRKGPDVLLKAYLNSFTAADDVCLVIKDFGGQSFYKGQTFEAQIQAAQEQPNAPEILYLNEELEPGELPGLYTACDALVHPYRGEGFGLPVLEAMACGLPVIVTGGGATDDFATEELAYRIPARRREIGDEISGIPLVSEGWLLEPDAEALAERMKWSATHREEARARGRLCSEEVRTRWTWKSAASSAVDRLKKLSAEPARQTAPPPKVSALPACAQLGNLTRSREFLGRKQYREAWNEALAALEARPFHPEACLLLAKIAAGAGDGNTARRCAERARALAPGWEASKQFLRKLSKGKARADWLKLPEEWNSVPRLTVCLIARNEERFIGHCLGSVREIANQIIVVDTGSTDRTVEIAKEHGAEVHAFTWCDDFSAARNVALEQARGDWVLVLDADEELPKEQHVKLLQDMKNAKSIALRLPLVNRGAEEEGRNFVPRLFRNAPKVFFNGRIHEQAFSSLLPPAKTLGMEIGFGTAQLLHHGYSKEVTNSREKIARNLRLLKLAATENPEDANLAMNLALELSRSGGEREGLRHYREAFRLLATQTDGGGSPELREALLSQFTSALLKQGEKEEALRVLNSPVAKHGGLSASLHYAAGLAHLERKQHRPAAEHLRQCIAKRGEPAFSPINQEILTAAPRHCLAMTLAQLGDAQGAEAAFKAALGEKGRTERIKIDYAEFLAANEQRVEALQLLYGVVTEQPGSEAAWQLGARIAGERAELIEFACDWTKEAVRHLPDSPEVLSDRAEILLLAQAPEEAKLILQHPGLKATRARAAFILCQLCLDENLVAAGSAEERAVSHEFLRLYRRMLEANAGEMVLRINGRLELLETVLPTAAQALRAAVAEAGAAVAA